jgi:hypothetical protein
MTAVANPPKNVPKPQNGGIRPVEAGQGRRGGSRGATAGTDRAGCSSIVEKPRSFRPTLKAGFVSSAQTGLETALLTGRPHRGMGSRQRLRMSITGTSSGAASQVTIKPRGRRTQRDSAPTREKRHSSGGSRTCWSPLLGLAEWNTPLTSRSSPRRWWKKCHSPVDNGPAARPRRGGP